MGFYSSFHYVSSEKSAETLDQDRVTSGKNPLKNAQIPKSSRGVTGNLPVMEWRAAQEH